MKRETWMYTKRGLNKWNENIGTPTFSLITTNVLLSQNKTKTSTMDVGQQLYGVTTLLWQGMTRRYAHDTCLTTCAYDTIKSDGHAITAKPFLRLIVTNKSQSKMCAKDVYYTICRNGNVCWRIMALQ